jgi:predicted anti-sigma-YlaC factor YlaD
MTCDVADVLIEAVVAGERPLEGELEAHVRGCARCRRALAVAREMDAVLSAQSEPTVRPELLTAALTRIRRERWRIEQSFDLAFNVVVFLTIVCVLGALGVLVSAVGFGAGLGGAIALVLERARPVLPIYGLATGLLAMTLGVWWWAERGFEL